MLTALLAILNAGIDEVLIVAEIHAIFDGHIRPVRIEGRRERASVYIVPNLYQSQKIGNLAVLCKRPTGSIRLSSNP